MGVIIWEALVIIVMVVFIGMGLYGNSKKQNGESGRKD